MAHGLAADPALVTIPTMAFFCAPGLCGAAVRLSTAHWSMIFAPHPIPDPHNTMHTKRTRCVIQQFFSTTVYTRINRVIFPTSLFWCRFYQNRRLSFSTPLQSLCTWCAYVVTFTCPSIPSLRYQSEPRSKWGFVFKHPIYPTIIPPTPQTHLVQHLYWS